VTIVLTRALRPGDAPALLRLLVAAQAVDQGGEHADLADVEHELADPGLDLSRDSVAVFDGELLVAQATAHPRQGVLAVSGVVDPAARGRGHGTALLGWARELAAARGLATLSVQTDDRVAGAVALFTRSGLSPVRHWYDMARELATGVGGVVVVEPTPRPVAGIVVEAVTARDSEEVRLLHGVAFADHWGSEPPDTEQWSQRYLGSPAWCPQVSLLARDDPGVVLVGGPGGGPADGPGAASSGAPGGTGVGPPGGPGAASSGAPGGGSRGGLADTAVGGRVVGYALGYEWPAETAATGIREAWLGQLGVAPGARGRGVGSLLLAAFTDRARAAGFDRVGLAVDVQNTSDALTLYQRAGFTTTATATTYRGPATRAG